MIKKKRNALLLYEVLVPIALLVLLSIVVGYLVYGGHQLDPAEQQRLAVGQMVEQLTALTCGDFIRWKDGSTSVVLGVARGGMMTVKKFGETPERLSVDQVASLARNVVEYKRSIGSVYALTTREYFGVEPDGGK